MRQLVILLFVLLLLFLLLHHYMGLFLFQTTIQLQYLLQVLQQNLMPTPLGKYAKKNIQLFKNEIKTY